MPTSEQECLLMMSSPHKVSYVNIGTGSNTRGLHPAVEQKLSDQCGVAS